MLGRMPLLCEAEQVSYGLTIVAVIGFVGTVGWMILLAAAAQV